MARQQSDKAERRPTVEENQELRQLVSGVMIAVGTLAHKLTGEQMVIHIGEAIPPTFRDIVLTGYGTSWTDPESSDVYQWVSDSEGVGHFRKVDATGK